MNTQLIDKRLEQKQKEYAFYGNIRVVKADKVLVDRTFGYANDADKLPNRAHTLFGIASGCKLFTALAICQLVEAGKLSLDTTLQECVPDILPNFDPAVTVHHLLTHTSGIPDYFDEEVSDDFEALWQDLPTYRVRTPRDFLPLFQKKAMADPVGSKVKYNNAGYILLGVIVEAVSGLHFTDYIEKNIFEKAEMTDAGYFAQDTLPRNTALGYIETESGLKTNIFSIPAKGGPDGGAYVSVEDLEKFWHALISGQLLSKTMTEIFLTPQVHEEDEFFYGYGGLMKVVEQKVVKYIQMGYDPGVNYHSVYYPDQQLLIAVCSNKSAHAYEMQEVLEEFFVD